MFVFQLGPIVLAAALLAADFPSARAGFKTEGGIRL